jgi:signal transduction histidine kinase
MGLFSMQERMALVDGHWQVISAPGAGTHVIATVPLVPQETL